MEQLSGTATKIAMNQLAGDMLGLYFRAGISGVLVGTVLGLVAHQVRRLFRDHPLP